MFTTDTTSNDGILSPPLFLRSAFPGVPRKTRRRYHRTRWCGRGARGDRGDKEADRPAGRRPAAHLQRAGAAGPRDRATEEGGGASGLRPVPGEADLRADEGGQPRTAGRWGHSSAVRAGRGRVAAAGTDQVPGGRTVEMLIITKRNAPEEALDAVKEYLIRHGFDIHQSTGANRTIIGVIGDTDTLDAREIEAMPGVSQVVRIRKDD